MSGRAEPRWFHLTTHTYGAWLPGDPRGFRTRHHREHVEGDYRNPSPPGTHDGQFARSRRLLKQPPVMLTAEWRRIVGEAVRDRLHGLGGQVLAVAMSATHFHALAKVPVESARDWVGQAKRHAWFLARDRGWAGQLWAKRSHAEPIADRKHHANTFWYIVRHRAAGAWVWTFRDPAPGSDPPPESPPPDGPLPERSAPESPPVATGGL